VKIGILYYSKTGNTKHLSEIAESLLGSMQHEVIRLPIDKFVNEQEKTFDLLVIGSYCDSNNYPKKVRDLFENLHENKCLASFVTHATYEDGPYYQKWGSGCEKYFNEFCVKNQITNRGYFHCRAKPSIPISIFIRKEVIQDNADWKEYKKDMNRYPGNVEISRFKEFIQNLVK
jgi:flavodoxin